MMDQVHWRDDLTAARAAAEDQQRPLLVDFYSSTCLGCAALEAEAYHDAEVIACLNQRFVPLQYNVASLPPEGRDLIRMPRPLFTPLLLFLDPGGAEIRRLTGYLPPADFLAELEFVLAWQHQLRGRYDQAFAGFRTVAERYPRTDAAPEALWWAGVAGYRLNGQGLDGLMPQWAELRDRYPDSSWWTRASCIAERLVSCPLP